MTHQIPSIFELSYAEEVDTIFAAFDCGLAIGCASRTSHHQIKGAFMDVSPGRWAEIVRRGLLEPPEVHEAAGAVSVQLDIRPTDAIARIRAYARLTGRSTSYIAEQVLDRELQFGADAA